MKLEGKQFSLAFAAVLTCGTLNNLVYCIICGASQSLAKNFGMGNYMTALSTCMNWFALLGTILSASFLIRFRFHFRIRAVVLLTAVSYAGVAIASETPGRYGFFLACAFASLGSLVQIVGELTNLAFLKNLPPELIGAWGGGTGVAGILGGGLYVYLSTNLGLSNVAVFKLMVPTVVLYLAAFTYLHGLATAGLKGVALERALGGEVQGGGRGHETEEEGDASAPLLNPVCGKATKLDGPQGSLPLTWLNARRTMDCAGGVLVNLVAVYCLEYTIFPGLADRETYCSGRAWYPVMWMSYNIGVTLSRLSVALFRIERVWILTLFQALNVFLWIFEVYTGFIRNSLPNGAGLYLVAAWIAVVGLCGGAAYVNCMYLFNNDPGIPNELRELGINMGLIMSNIGISCATSMFVRLDNTIMNPTIIFPHGCPS